MIRQICPSCYRYVELPDAAAGGTADCPACGKPFAVPAGYTPTVEPPPAPPTPAAPPPGFVPAVVTPPAADRPPPPPGLVQPGERAARLPSGLVMLGPGGTPSPAAAGYTEAIELPLEPAVVGWAAPVSLAAAFVLTFFSWVGTFPHGAVYTQTPWEALIGTGTNHTLALDEWRELRKAIPANVLLLLPYFACLTVAMVLAWLERFDRYQDVAKLFGATQWAPLVTQHRVALMTGLGTAAFVLLAVQSASGFGLETVIAARVEAEQEKLRDGKPPPVVTPAQMGEVAGRYSLRGTTALRLAVVAHTVAMLALAGRLWLERRGPGKPVPKVVGYW